MLWKKKNKSASLHHTTHAHQLTFVYWKCRCGQHTSTNVVVDIATQFISEGAYFVQPYRPFSKMAAENLNKSKLKT